jgi:hypothetical protein
MHKLLTAAALLLTTQVALADPGNGRANGYQGQGRGNHNGHYTAPAPIIGAGLPALSVIGIAAGFVFVRWRRRR